MTTRPPVECDETTPCVAVPDIGAAVQFYTEKLGFEPGFLWGDPPTFAGVVLGKVRLFLSKSDPAPSARPVAFFTVADADALYDFQRSNGVEIAEEIGDRPWGMRDYVVRDPHGYYVVFGHNAFNMGPPVRVERVEVCARIEKRLAALLDDLATHKRMTVGSCLEEMILHTNEGVGPHTNGTLRYIQQLKQKHGIDYDCHASYRFVEE